MKNFMFVAAVLFSGSALASDAAMEIYKVLNVKETPVPAERTKLVYQKTLSGLVCTHTNHIVNGDSYACKFTLAQFNAEEIYKAMDVQPVPISGIATRQFLAKSAGGLQCVESTPLASVNEKITYFCTVEI